MRIDWRSRIFDLTSHFHHDIISCGKVLPPAHAASARRLCSNVLQFLRTCFTLLIYSVVLGKALPRLNCSQPHCWGLHIIHHRLLFPAVLMTLVLLWGEDGCTRVMEFDTRCPATITRHNAPVVPPCHVTGRWAWRHDDTPDWTEWRVSVVVTWSPAKRDMEKEATNCACSWCRVIHRLA